jgi:hypothetical protein
MRLLISLTIAACCLANAAFAQSGLLSAQKEFKTALIKHTKNVYAVDFSGCAASVKVVSSFSSGFSSSMMYPPVQGTAGFPGDVLQPSFGMEPPILKSFRYFLDLAGLDADNIAVRPGFRKNTSVITLNAGNDVDAIRTNKDKKIEPAASFFVVTSARSAPKTAAAIKAMIERCSASK